METHRGIAVTAALVSAIALPAVSWLFFRQPGVSMWVAWVPIWRANEYLTGTGIVLRLAAVPAVTVAAALILIECRELPMGADDPPSDIDSDDP